MLAKTDKHDPELRQIVADVMTRIVQSVTRGLLLDLVRLVA